MLTEAVHRLRRLWRPLRQRPIATGVIVATLAITFTTALVALALVDALLLMPLRFGSERSVHVTEIDERTSEDLRLSVGSFLELRSRSRTLQNFALVETRIEFREWLLTSGGPTEYVRATTVSPAFFESLAVAPILGRAFRPESPDVRTADREIIISHGLWQRRYGGSTDVIGKEIEFQKWLTHTIVGVMPPGFDYPDRTDVWAPLIVTGVSEKGRLVRYGHALATVRPGYDVSAASAELSVISAQLRRDHPNANAGVATRTVSLRDATVRDIRPTLLLVTAVGLCVFLIACVNVSSILAWRNQERRQEMATKAALGASHSRLYGECLSECAVLVGIASVIGLALASWTFQAIIGLLPASWLPRFDGMALSTRSAAIALGLGILATFLCALGSVFGGLGTATGSLNKAGGGSSRKLQPLIVAEVALAVTAAVAAGLLLKSYYALSRVAPGFSVSNVSVSELRLPARKFDDVQSAAVFYEELLNGLRASPDVVAAAGISDIPFSRRLRTALASSFPADVSLDQLRFPAAFHVVTPGYFDVMQIPLKAGRDFTHEDGPASLQSGNAAAIINERLARDLFGKEAVGKQIVLTQFSARMIVVGVVGDVLLDRMSEQAKPQVYLSHLQFPRTGLDVVAQHRSDARPSDLHAFLRRFDSDIAIIRTSPVEQLVHEATEVPRLQSSYVTALAAIAVLLASIGVYGVAAQSVVRRRHELAVRMALGGTTRGVLAVAFRQAITPVLVGVFIGELLAAFSSEMLESLLFGTVPLEVGAFAGAGLLMTLIAAVSQVSLLRSVVRISPSAILREIRQ